MSSHKGDRLRIRLNGCKMKNNIEQKSCVIYLIGKSGIGKYTIAQELAKANFIICDNQLINNPIFTLLNYDGFSKIPDIGWEAIRRIRTAVIHP